ncbi:MAG: ABC transporter ATP-binding protein [Myxococcales bacterium]|nr:ABC transporter ATP-binding protein [Myxococcales bacterium]
MRLLSAPVALQFERVEVRKLVKLYGATRALSGLDLDLKAGEITSIEGPNGSGKSTLLSILALLSRPTRGSLRFGSHDPSRLPALRGRIGLVGHAAMVYPDLSGDENLALLSRLHDAGDHALSEMGKRFELGAFMQRPARTYSRGQLQRLSLARALLNRPALLLLDEPSTGLDGRGVERLCEAVRQERDRGAIVALVTHDTALAERLADRRVRLRRGRLEQAERAGEPA